MLLGPALAETPSLPSSTETLSDRPLLGLQLRLHATTTTTNDISGPSTPLVALALASRGRTLSILVQKCRSARLAAKANGSFTDMTSMAVCRKAVLNSISGCSAGLKKNVTVCNILSHNKLLIGVADLRKLVSAAGISCSSAGQLVW